MTAEIAASMAFRFLLKAAQKNPSQVGEMLYQIDESGHSALCRFLRAIAHYGPSGTFVRVDCVRLEAGGSLCSFGVECGKPTRDYLRHQNQISEEMLRLHKILETSGALISMCWENPLFSAQSLCTCGKNDERKLPLHDPLCPYRVKHDFRPSIEEYRTALGRTQ